MACIVKCHFDHKLRGRVVNFDKKKKELLAQKEINRIYSELDVIFERMDKTDKTQVPTKLSYDLKLEQWNFKLQFASKKHKNCGDYKFWTLVFEETDKCVAGGGEANVSNLYKV